MVSGFVPPPFKPGKYLFGIHNVGVSGNWLSIFDMWMDSAESPIECVSAEYVLRTSQIMLDVISDELYLKLAGNKDENEVLARSDVWLLDDLQVSLPEQF
jgi:hypothetical protein